METNKAKGTGVAGFYTRHKKGVKIFLFVFVTCALLFRGLMQQPTIDANKEKIAELQEQIEYEEYRKTEIEAMKDEVNSDEYIEKVAREKLGMIKENEKVFIDVSSQDD